MTEEQIQAVKQSDDPEQAAMEYVQQGAATHIEFSGAHIVGFCGKEKRNLEQTSAHKDGGWQDFVLRVGWGDMADEFLFQDSSSVIVPGTMKDEGVASVIEELQSALEEATAIDSMEENFRSEDD